MRLLVIGGARFSGRALTGLALDRGHQVTMFHRGGGPDDPWPEAEHLHGDRKEGFEPLRGRSFDAVVDTCAFVTDDIRLAADAFPDVATYTFISSLSAHVDGVRAGATEEDDVYQPPFPEVQELTMDLYGPLKVACEHLVRERYPRGAHRGPTRLHRGAARPDRSIHVLGAPSLPWRGDAGSRAALVRHAVGGRTRSGGFRPRSLRASDRWHVQRRHRARSRYDGLDPGSRPVARRCRHRVPLDRRCVRSGPRGSSTIPVDPLPMWHPDEANFHAFDTSRAVAAGLEIRPMGETICDLLAWDEERGAPWPLKAGLDPERELRLLAAWHGRTRSLPAQES